MIIKNYEELSVTEQRRKFLEIIEEGLMSIQPDFYLPNVFRREENRLFILNKEINLNDFERIFLIGFGKGAARTCKFIENLLKDKIDYGLVIDVVEERFEKLKSAAGTHPLPSEINFQFAQEIKNFAKNLKEKDLVLVVIYGGGSALLISPAKISLEKYIKINEAMLKSGMDIYEMNTVRKHLDEFKGGGLAKFLQPSKVISLIASDVPGNDISFIASGPTVEDRTTIEDAWRLIEKYKLKEIVKREELIETVKSLSNVENIIILSNRTILEAMEKKIENLGYKSKILSDKLQGEVSEVAEIFYREFLNLNKGEFLLAGGETTVDVKNKEGKGGRNQELALYFLKIMLDKNERNFLFASFDSDGWDNSEHAGALVDDLVLEKVKSLNLDLNEYLSKNDSFYFFQKLNSAIITGRLPTNVADIMILWRF
jgi:glycerate 2-kinase